MSTGRFSATYITYFDFKLFFLDICNKKFFQEKCILMACLYNKPFLSVYNDASHIARHLALTGLAEFVCSALRPC